MATEQKITGNSSGVELRELDPQPVLSIRENIRTEQLGETMGERLQALQAYLRQSGAQPAGPPFVRYHTFSDTETDMELGVPLKEPAAGEGRIAAGELPGGSAAVTEHLGAHDKLGEAYGRIAAWVEENHRESAGPAREVYYWIDLSKDLDPSGWDPSTWRTELIQPVK